jgi:multidrug resistance efflux pump
MVSGLAMWLTYWMTGPMVFFNAEGFVDAQRRVVAVEFPAQVMDVHVEPGDYVTPGQTIASIHSHNITTRIAELESRRSDLRLQRATITARQDEIDAILPLSRQRVAETTEHLEGLRKLLKKGIVTKSMMAGELAEHHATRSELSRLEVQVHATKTELKAVEAALVEVDEAIGHLATAYSDGAVKAPHAGVVAPARADIGEVLEPGRPVVELLSGWPFVTAYLPNNRMWSVERGDRVVVSDGNDTAHGRVDRIDLVAATVPAELQSAFRARDRREVIRIRFEEMPPFPLRAKVRVGRALQPNTLVASIRGLFGSETQMIASEPGRRYTNDAVVLRDQSQTSDIMTGAIGSDDVAKNPDAIKQGSAHPAQAMPDRPILQSTPGLPDPDLPIGTNEAFKPGMSEDRSSIRIIPGPAPLPISLTQ